jgi:hypothetical protein
VALHAWGTAKHLAIERQRTCPISSATYASLSEGLMAAAAEPISGIAHRLIGKLSTRAPIVFRDGEQHRQYDPAAPFINYLDSPLPGIPAPAREERSTPYQLHGVMVCRPEILKFHTIQVGYLLAALAREVEQVARHQSHPRSTRWMILNLAESARVKVYEWLTPSRRAST